MATADVMLIRRIKGSIRLGGIKGTVTVLFGMSIVFASLPTGSHLLPANLDFFNFARDESLAEEGSSRPRTPVSAEQGGQSEQTRESTPESSSSGSNMNEELLEITTPFSTVLCILESERVLVFVCVRVPKSCV